MKSGIRFAFAALTAIIAACLFSPPSAAQVAPAAVEKPAASSPPAAITHRSRGLNYGLNKLRFTAPVPVDSRVRLRQKLLAADDVKDSGIRLTFENTIDIEGKDQPALVAEALSIVFP